MKILGFAGSLRAGSYNKKALRVALQGAKEAGAEIEEIDLRELNIPLFDADVEEKDGLPKSVKIFKKKIEEVDALLIASPEYNNSMSGVLKNVIDWASRKGEEGTKVFYNKPAAIITASPGRFGGLKSAIAFRPVARTLGMQLMNEEVQVANAGEVFDEDKIVNERVEGQLKDLGKALVDWTIRLKKPQNQPTS